MKTRGALSFYNTHKGETALLVGNGPNLYKTPPEWFNYPSFGLNTIHKYEGWKPDYYVAVDYCIYEEFGDEISAAFPDIPKFVPTHLSHWQGDNFIVVKKRAGDVIVGTMLANKPDALEKGLGYLNVMHLAMQLAWHMGFTTLLMIGVEQKPGRGELSEHFWGKDPLTPDSQTDEHWNIGYKAICSAMTGVKVLNISEGTYVPEDILPRGDWREWKNK